MSYTTPHYYLKYEIQAIENFLVEDPFKYEEQILQKNELFHNQNRSIHF